MSYLKSSHISIAVQLSLFLFFSYQHESKVSAIWWTTWLVQSRDASFHQNIQLIEALKLCGHSSGCSETLTH